MGIPHSPPPAALLLAVISRHASALEWTRARLIETAGPIGLESPAFEFRETDYYESTMGTGLRKTFLVSEPLIDPGAVADWKLRTQSWEAEYAALGQHEEPRPLNLDPGYLTLAKLVLASTKDHAHRIYLRDGIFAEVTLNYRNGGWQPHEWTFPDYRRADFHAFFDAVRAWLKSRKTA